jgi:uncharacterized membrane protein YbhN (UPF0104 family)
VNRYLRMAVAALVLAVLIVWGLRVMDLRALWNALAHASAAWVVLAMAVAGGVCLPAAARRGWQIVAAFPSPSPMRFGDYFELHAATSVVNSWLASPAGEVLRTVTLTRRGGYTLVAAAASQIVDRLVDALGLALQAIAVALTVPLPPKLLLTAKIAAIAAPLGALLLFTLTRASKRMQSLGPALNGRTLARSMAWSLLNDAGNIGTVMLCALAVGASLSIGAGISVVVVARLSGLIPATPGQLGVQEAGIVLALGLVGIDHEQALALAIVYRASHLFPITLIGLACFARMRRR